MSDESPKPTRRAALQGLGAAALASLVPGCDPVTGEPVVDPTQPPSWEALRERVDTVVVLMMENRSFDHYLGALSLVEGRTDVDGLQPGMSNPHPWGYDVEPTLAEEPCAGGAGIHWDKARIQFAEGTNTGFVEAGFSENRPEEEHARAMKYFDRSTIQTYYALADRYTVCDRWFASVMSSTWPNRFCSHAGQNGGVRGNDPPTEPFETIYTRLNAIGVSWGCFYSNLPALTLTPDRSLTEDNFEEIERFFVRAETGTLPQVTIVEPVWGRNSDHPDEHPVAGQIFAHSIYDALINSPQWERTLFIITYDEHGGFYDHVPPGQVPDDRADEGFDQLGFRVPSLLVGPWVRAGEAVHTQFEHTSILAFLEGLHDLPPMTMRDAAANDLRDGFDPVRVASGEPLSPEPIAAVQWPEDDLNRPECGNGGDLFRDEGQGVTGWPELDAHADLVLAGTRLDRREQTDEIHDWLLQRAKDRGIWQG